jgi:peptidoglycan hydrolase-like protein with peptidoglycan-binding domain
VSGELGSPVCPCAGGAAHASTAGEGTPVDEAAHRDCRIRLVSVTESQVEDSMEYIDSANDIFVKGIDLARHQLLIRYEVTGCTMNVTLWVEHEPGNTVHANFYAQYEGEGVSGRRVVTIVNGQSKAPGMHEVLWDGRDKTGHHRILLSGQYLLKVQGLHDVTRSDQSTIKVMSAFSYNHGIHYAGGNTTQRECEHASDRQQNLVDGTGYFPNTIVASPAREAWENMRQGALGIVSGHSNPNELLFYPEASRPGHEARFRRDQQSFITQVRLAPNFAGHEDSVSIPLEPDDSLRDMLLSIMAGCRAGNEVLNVQERLKYLHRSLDPGRPDGDHGRRTTAALSVWQDWEGLSPADGTKTPETLARMGVDPALDEASQTLAVQTRLRALARRYDPGAVDGRWGPSTEGALTRYQEDHSPPLTANSLPDAPTLRSLRLDAESGRPGRNIAEMFCHRGCNLVVGFVKKVSFRAAEAWHMHFWDLAAQGVGVDDACAQARDLCRASMRPELEYTLYNRSDVDRNLSLHPARHGVDM